MASLAFFTYQDAVNHLNDLVGSGDQGTKVLKAARRAVAAAYRLVPAGHDWSYYQRQGRITTVAPYSTGTVTYDHTGGSVERELTLDSGTWPDWAVYGYIVIADVYYFVQTRVSDTVLQLSETHNPGADVAAGTSYQLIRNTYTLPADWQNSGAIIQLSNNAMLEYVSPDKWLDASLWDLNASTAWAYTFRGDPVLPNRMAVSFWYAESTVDQFDFLYKSQPLPVRTQSYSTGTVSVSGTTVTGTGTAWTSKHVGSVIRFSVDADAPEGLESETPFHDERIITAVTDGTHLTIQSALDTAPAGNAYRISDILDIDVQRMMEPFLRCAEWQYVMFDSPSDMKEVNIRHQFYRQALLQAFEFDDRDSSSAGSATDGRFEWWRLRAYAEAV